MRLQASLFLLLFLLLVPASFSLAGEKAAEPAASGQHSHRTRAQRLMALTGDGDFGDERTAWDKTYARRDYVFGKDPVRLLVDHIQKLPKGHALDIATGEGRNAVYLAKKGFLVEGVDISVVGLRKAKRLAAENGVSLQTTNADLKSYRILPDHYSVIINFYYLQRNLFPQIKAGLKKGGVLVFETHTTEHRKNSGAENWEKEFLLQPGELKKAFSDFEILHYAETNDGKNAVASLVARKR